MNSATKSNPTGNNSLTSNIFNWQCNQINSKKAFQFKPVSKQCLLDIILFADWEGRSDMVLNTIDADC